MVSEIRADILHVDDPLIEIDESEFFTQLTTVEKILYTLSQGPLSPSQIAERASLDVDLVKKHIKKKYKDGYVGLLADKYVEKAVIDGKDWFYAVTPQGRSVVQAAVNRYRGELLVRLSRKKQDREIQVKVGFYKEFFSRFMTQGYDFRTLKRLTIDFYDLCKSCFEYADELLDHPVQELAAMGIALENIDQDYGQLKIGVHNLPAEQCIAIGSIRCEHINKLFCFEGLIKQTSSVRPKVAMTRFECPSCGAIIPVLQGGIRFIEPTGCGCGRRGKFRILETRRRDFQVLKLEEKAEDLDGRARTQEIDILLYDDLTEPKFQYLYNPGSHIKITGILKSDFKVQNRIKSSEQTLCVEAVHVEALEVAFDFVPTHKEKHALTELGKQEGVIDLLVESLAPNIYGYGDIKRAILCQLVQGGLLKGKRRDIHILLVGDPGLGKTQLAYSVLDLIPNSRLISGEQASDVGLTASVVRDDLSGEWSVRVGALPLANRSLAVLDELDKMEDTKALHSALEAQEIRVNKAGLNNVRLQCKTSVLATANPKAGKFDPSGPDLVRQINLPASLFSRFDLVFALMDSTDNDAALARFIVQESTGEVKEPPLTRDVLRKYLSYARSFDPVLSTDNMSKLIEQYVRLRKGGSLQNITPRQLQAMQRLAASFAKLRLSHEINVEDIENAIRLVVGCFAKLNGGDVSVVESGFSETYRQKRGRILEYLAKGESAELDHLLL
jgi:replicative DNA helicase Mcm